MSPIDQIHPSQGIKGARVMNEDQISRVTWSSNTPKIEHSSHDEPSRTKYQCLNIPVRLGIDTVYSSGKKTPSSLVQEVPTGATYVKPLHCLFLFFFFLMCVQIISTTGYISTSFLGYMSLLVYTFNTILYFSCSFSCLRALLVWISKRALGHWSLMLTLCFALVGTHKGTQKRFW